MLSLIELGPARHNSRNPSRLDQRPPPLTELAKSIVFVAVVN